MHIPELPLAPLAPLADIEAYGKLFSYPQRDRREAQSPLNTYEIADNAIIINGLCLSPLRYASGKLYIYII